MVREGEKKYALGCGNTNILYIDATLASCMNTKSQHQTQCAHWFVILEEESLVINIALII